MSETIDELSREDTFDSREVIERIEELEAIEVIDREPEEQDELDRLSEFADEASSVADWQYGETFIADDYFEDYARELAEDVGAVRSAEEWPLSYIDWDAAAGALLQDYIEFDLNGVTFWARA